MPPRHLADVYVSLATAEKLNGYADRTSMLCIVLEDPAAAGEFAKAWKDRLAAAQPAAATWQSQAACMVRANTRARAKA